MCLQCVCESIEIGHIVSNNGASGSGVYLQRASKDTPSDEIFSGDLLIGRINDPDIVIPASAEIKFVKDKYWGMTDKEIDASTVENHEFYRAVEKLREFTYTDINAGHDIIERCKTAGYNKTEHGSIECWLVHKIAELLENKNANVA